LWWRISGLQMLATEDKMIFIHRKVGTARPATAHAVVSYKILFLPLTFYWPTNVSYRI
jgi:hypothetical protein